VRPDFGTGTNYIYDTSIGMKLAPDINYFPAPLAATSQAGFYLEDMKIVNVCFWY
jgi:hypothetical protein